MILRLDNFYLDPMAEREKAISSEYKTIVHNGYTFYGMSPHEDEDGYAKISQALEMPYKKALAFYRMYLKEHKAETYIHNDVLIGTVTGIVYLNTPDQCTGGTAFWKHKKYGFTSSPSVEELYSNGLNEEYYKTIHDEGFDQDKWEMIDFAEMRFNRLILFDSPRFHSKFPMVPFGTNIQDARLLKVFFLTL